MKRATIVTLIFAFGLFMIVPSAGYSWHYYGPRYHHGCCSYNGWGTAAVVVGTIVTGAIIVSAINQSYQYRQPPTYAYQRPVTVYQPPIQPYAAPDPDFVAKYSKKSPSGEWVSVPGQWAGDKWVPPHTVYVPSSK